MDNLFKCTKCNILKKRSDFYKDKQKSSGYRPDCKDCNKKQCNIWAKNNPEKRKQYVLKHATGLDKTTYNELEFLQDYTCAICNKKVKDRKLAVDHCHKTNLVRGLLCTKCNMGLGYFNDDKLLLQSAALYLDNNFQFKNIIYGKQKT